MSPLQENKPINVAILLYDQVEELDFCGPFEVFKSAAFTATSIHGWEQPAMQVFTVAEYPGLVTTSGELLIQPHFTFENHPRIDLLVVPGGNSTPQVENSVLQEWLSKVVRQTEINASVCTGADILAKVGLLDNHKVTTHWSNLDHLAEMVPTAEVQTNVRWVDEGTLVTGAGISAGIDMSLHIVERLFGRQTAEAVARYMEYNWSENPA
jgi:transcriptional regulator GlxA family with amidase domain